MTRQEFTKVTIWMPTAMFEEMQRRARERGISVTEMIRQAVALDKAVFAFDSEGAPL